MAYTLDFSRIWMKRILEVGGKNASLGEMFNHLSGQGVSIPDGFAVTASAYWKFLKHNGLEARLCDVLRRLDGEAFSNLGEVGARARALLAGGTWPEDVREEILAAHARLAARCPPGASFAVRSSATAEDLPGASFAGQMESFLNVAGDEALLAACRRCFVSLHTDRAIKYRVDKGFEHMDVAVSVCIQRMVRSDLACSGVGFTLDPETGNTNVVVLNAAFGLGDNVVQGAVTPDQFLVFKGEGREKRPALVSRKLGAKEKTLVYAGGDARTVNRETPADKRAAFSLTNDEAVELARHCLRIEEYYGQPMDVEWAKDGLDGKLYIVQARPETVHGRKRKDAVRRTFTLEKRGAPLVQGAAVGEGVVTGRVRRLKDPSESGLLRAGEILVTETTHPDWDPVLRRAAAIVTDKGGRTSHAAIVARELGVVALVGTGRATALLTDGQEVTVSCAEGASGYVYPGRLPFTVVETPEVYPASDVAAMLIVADPEAAFRLARLPSAGVGLLRLEFVIQRAIGVHPMALLKWSELPEGKEKEAIREKVGASGDGAGFFVEKLAEAVGTVAAAFHPRPVIVRFSDFKSNEYANLLGGSRFEPSEENPMLGFRGASRYYHPDYREAFRLECGAMLRVREEMGLANVKLMIPFCRTLEEAEKVEAELAENRLRRGENGLEVYMMAEIPSNVLLLDRFAAHFDGFSIGSNDLTQLTLGIDRDSERVSPLFRENDPAVRSLIALAIREAHRCGRKIGLCGQAPSDDADFAAFLASRGIDSIAFNPDAFGKGMVHLSAKALPARERF